MTKQPTEKKQLWRSILDVFLPDGYPNSVSDDYTAYQIFDSFQAFAGTIAGMIGSRAVWQGLGVGDSAASPTGAMLVQVIRECMGKLATIFFAHRMGTSIEAECKAYRLGADLLTETAMIIDCMSPWFPTQVRFLVLCISSVLFSASGVAGHASKSSLSEHFAKWNNLGELNAKDGSQETVISLAGMMTGTLVIPWLTTPFRTWFALLLLLGLHFVLNRIGVRAVEMRSLNRQRANIAFSSLLTADKALTPSEISKQETIFERHGGAVFRWNCGPVVARSKFGASIIDILSALAIKGNHVKTGAMNLDEVLLSTLMDLFRSEDYILWCQTPRQAKSSATVIMVVLKEGATAQSQIRAWYHGLLLARHICELDGVAWQQDLMFGSVSRTLAQTSRTFDAHAKRLTEAGWDLSIPVLETSSGSRIRLNVE